MAKRQWRRQVDLTFELDDDLLDAARPGLREFLLEQLSQHGGVVPNDFVDNDGQAAEHAAQDDQMAISLLISRAVLIGMEQLVPGTLVRQEGRPLPD